MRVGALADRLKTAMDAGAKKVMIPTENKRDFTHLPADIIDKLQVVFDSDPTNAAFRAGITWRRRARSTTEAVDTEAAFLYPTAVRQGTRQAPYHMTHDRETRGSACSPRLKKSSG